MFTKALSIVAPAMAAPLLIQNPARAENNENPPELRVAMIFPDVSPIGEHQFLANYHHDQAIMKFERCIGFETDIDVVGKIIKKVGTELIENEEFGPLMLEPLKSQGVNRMDDSSWIMRCKFTALPGQQFYVRRQAFTIIQRAFDAKGIKFAPKHVIVESTSSDDIVQAAAADTARQINDKKTANPYSYFETSLIESDLHCQHYCG